MSIEKDEVTINEVIGAYLNYTPTYRETEQLQTDLRTMNHTLIRDAIVECTKAGKVRGGASRGEKRRAMHAVYTRKVKELASIYPFLFSVENALRSLALDVYAQKFNDPFWWKIFLPEDPRDEATKKNEANFPLSGETGKKHIRGRLVNPRFVSEVLFGINQVMSQRQLTNLSSPTADPQDFFRNLTFKSLFEVILADYNLCPIGRLKKTDFRIHCNTLHVARNEIFHGNPIRNRGTVFTASERVLDAVDIHLGDLDEALRTATYARMRSSIVRADRHCIPPEG